MRPSINELTFRAQCQQCGTLGPNPKHSPIKGSRIVVAHRLALLIGFNHEVFNNQMVLLCPRCLPDFKTT